MSWLARMFLVLALAAPAAAGLFRVWVNQDAVQVGYALSEQVQRREKLHQAKRKLQVELAAELAPERLQTMAANLGLVPLVPGAAIGGGDDGR